MTTTADLSRCPRLRCIRRKWIPCIATSIYNEWAACCTVWCLGRGCAWRSSHSGGTSSPSSLHGLSLSVVQGDDTNTATRGNANTHTDAGSTIIAHVCRVYGNCNSIVIVIIVIISFFIIMVHIVCGNLTGFTSFPCAAPVTMAHAPSFALAFFSAIFRFAAPSALGKFSWCFLPLSTSHIRALSDSTLRVIFSACVAHDHSGPALNFWGYGRNHHRGVQIQMRHGRAEGESFDERKQGRNLRPL